jgi:hypothetical protein
MDKTKISANEHPWHDKSAPYNLDSNPDKTMNLCQEEVDEVIGTYSPPIKQIDVKIQVFGDKLMVFTLHFHTGRRIYRQHHWSISKQCLEHTVVMLGEPTTETFLSTTYYSHPPEPPWHAKRHTEIEHTTTKHPGG